MYGGNTSGCQRVYNWAAADKYYHERDLPRGKYWDSHQRPLDDNRKHHYRIEQHKGGEYYDLVLFRTVMARFYRPDKDGFERRLYTADGHQTSKSFVWDVLGNSFLHNYWTTDGRKVAAPVYTNDSIDDEFTPFSLEVWINERHKLDVSRSKHTPHYRCVSNDEDKAHRVWLKERFANLVLLAVMRMPEFAANAQAVIGSGWRGQRRGRPFRGDDLSYAAQQEMRKMCRPEVALEDCDVTKFIEMAQEAYWTMRATREYNAPVRHTGGKYVSEGIAEITPEEFMRSLQYRIEKFGHADAKSGREELPQFMDYDDYPKSNVTTHK